MAGNAASALPEVVSASEELTEIYPQSEKGSRETLMPRPIHGAHRGYRGHAMQLELCARAAEYAFAKVEKLDGP